MRKTASILALVISLMLLFNTSACFANEPSGELKIGLPTLYDQTFHPIWGTLYRRQYMEPMYDYIIGVDADGKYVSEQSVAYKWERTDDLLTWTFYIRKGIKFHNGDDLTNEDVRYTLEQAATKKNNAGSQSDFMEHIAKVETMAPDKVVVSLKKPWPTFINALTALNGAEGLIQPKKYIEEKGDDYFMSHPVGSGPYKFFEWKEGVHVKFVAQDTHWRVGTPKYKYLTFQLMPEEGSRDAALRVGELDIISVGMDRSKRLKKDGFVLQEKKDGLYVGLMWIQQFQSDFPINNKKVREALVYAIDKKTIVDYILAGSGRVVGTATSMFTWAIEYKPYPHTPYDPEKAKQLLTEAGFPKGFTMYLYSFVTKLPETKLINEAIASYWEAVGVKTKLLEMDYSAFKPVWTKKAEPPGPAAFILAWPNRPVYSWRHMYASDALYSHTKDPVMDQLIGDFESETSSEGYIEGARKIMDYVLENAYATGICTTHELHAMSKDVPVWEMGKGVGSYRWEYIGK
ncbi:MAG: ABC transporter substrate-binding protein [Desulfobacteraceae bacterium]|nr:ABC transporter substrate-binding protein [Desulfobacteraceae bacterium]